MEWIRGHPLLPLGSVKSTAFPSISENSISASGSTGQLSDEPNDPNSSELKAKQAKKPKYGKKKQTKQQKGQASHPEQSDQEREQEDEKSKSCTFDFASFLGQLSAVGQTEVGGACMHVHPQKREKEQKEQKEEEEALSLLQQRLLAAGVQTQLRRYQLQGVRWMCARESRPDYVRGCVSLLPIGNSHRAIAQESEGGGEGEDEGENEDEGDREETRVGKGPIECTADGWLHLQLPTDIYAVKAASSGQSTAATSNRESDDPNQSGRSANSKSSFWYNLVSGVFCSDEPPAVPLVSGGILADEMGIGKSLQVKKIDTAHPL
jgi:SNF2 family DNA or RNA helicase